MSATDRHPDATRPPSSWVRRFTPLIAPDARVLDVACGSGRHLRWLLAKGLDCLGVDRDPFALAQAPQGATTCCADIENGPWPFVGQVFGAVIVVHYLWRPRMPDILRSVAPGGLLLYETFGHQQARIGRPRRPDFLLQPGELLQHCKPADWDILAFEEGLYPAPARFLQRIAARRRANAAGSVLQSAPSPAATLE